MGVSRVSGSFGTSRSPEQDNSCHVFCEDRGHEVLELLSILLLLQTHERMTSQELTRRFEVSPRTILRDVEALPAAGVPIHTVARSCWTSLVSIRESFSCSLSRGWTRPS
ncbi:hypothetical protein JCM18909_833 [Cutibacterium acnes JCM 18909]|nr:hypothetical protein JCM18909_833 [Cutibacterium acnes JCM 18909]